MLIKSAEYELTAVKPQQYPEGDLPEAVFVGRSNVGKSSMINALCNRKSMARTSSTPGKTRQINFYNVNNELRLVDLPGYGYASVSKSEVVKWRGFIENYLTKRVQLKLVIQLIDIRHLPTKDDVEMFQWLKERDIPYCICGVKTDKISKLRYMENARKIINKLEPEPDTPFVLFSSQKNMGVNELWDVIEYYLKDGENDEIL